MSHRLTSTGEPLALPEVCSGACNDLDIVEVCIADSGATVPPIHRVDGFRELSAGLLVDTAGVNPAELQSFSLGLLTGQSDLGEACLLLHALR